MFTQMQFRIWAETIVGGIYCSTDDPLLRIQCFFELEMEPVRRKVNHL